MRETEKLTIQAMQWAQVADIDETVPLNDSDEACLREVREVLSKYGKLEKFGLTLIHSHFPIADDEVLVENVSKVTRTLTITPMKKSEVGTAVDTMWSLNTDDNFLESSRKCIIHPPGHYVG